MTTFVSAIFDIYNNKDDEVDIRKSKQKRLDRFEELAKTGIQIVLFCCPVYELLLQPMLAKYSNVKLLFVIKFQDLLAYKIINNYENKFQKQLTLPFNRSEIKDTREYMILMNSKAEFIRRAIEANIFNSQYFCWIDFSILYMFPEREAPLAKLKHISNQAGFNNKKCIIMPSCNQKNNNDYLNEINWRFCGGFFVGDKESLLEFTATAINMFYIFLSITNKLIWEVNYWNWLEQGSMFNPTWYQANFSQYIINNIPL